MREPKSPWEWRVHQAALRAKQAESLAGAEARQREEAEAREKISQATEELSALQSRIFTLAISKGLTRSDVATISGLARADRMSSQERRDARVTLQYLKGLCEKGTGSPDALISRENPFLYELLGGRRIRRGDDPDGDGVEVSHTEFKLLRALKAARHTIDIESLFSKSENTPWRGIYRGTAKDRGRVQRAISRLNNSRLFQMSLNVTLRDDVVAIHDTGGP
jgi:hypothetical protein